MSPRRLGAYQLGEELVSSGHLVEYRAVKLDRSGTPADPVFLCGLRSIASNAQRRTRVADALRKLRDHVTLPHCPRILDVIQYGKRSDYDVAVVSEFSEGCSLESLLRSTDDRVPDPKLSLYVLNTLCATVTAFHRHPVTGAQGCGLGALSTASVWIDRQAAVTVHNPFLGLALAAARPDDQGADALHDDVQALQGILRQLTAPRATENREGETTRPEPIQRLLELQPKAGEARGDYAERFADAVDGVASQYRTGWAVAVVGLAAFDTVFDVQAVFSPAADGASGAMEVEESTPAAASEAGNDRTPSPSDDSRPPAARPSPATTELHASSPTHASLSSHDAQGLESVAALPGHPEARDDDALALPLHAFPEEPEGSAPEPTVAAPSPTNRMALAGLVAVVGVGAFLAGGFLARQGAPFSGGGVAEVDLRDVAVDPPHARLYLDVSDTNQVLTLPEGVHELEVRADGHETTRVTIEVTPGQTVTIPESVTLPAERPTIFGYLDLDGLTVQPADARITVDGESILDGVTQVLAPGIHTLSVTRAGFAPQTRDITIEAGETVSLDQTITLAAAVRPAAVTVSAEVPVQVLEDGRVLGTAPFSASVTPGGHTFEFRHEDLSVALDYDVQSGEALDIALQIVRVNSQPFGEVAIVGEGGVPVAAGTTPGRVLLPVGGSLLFTHPQFESQQVSPEPGQTAVSVSFR